MRLGRRNLLVRAAGDLEEVADRVQEALSTLTETLTLAERPEFGLSHAILSDGRELSLQLAETIHGLQRLQGRFYARSRDFDLSL